jgi:hypothetical protein|tara:strand:+ start:349 stop:555 length:207 start_codon:yes stop_codon:yes gene_type:complete
MENTPKDMLTHIREQEEILNISLQQSRSAKKERLAREQQPPMQQQQGMTPEQHAEWIRQQKLPIHNQE